MLVAQARAHMARGELATGTELARQALLTTGQEAGEAHLLLAMAAVMRDDAPAALQHAQQAVAALPQEAQAHLVLGRAWKAAQNLPAAVAAYRRAIELQPAQAEAHVSLGIALKHAGDLAGALRCHERAVALNPRLAAAHANLAYTRAALAEQAALAGHPEVRGAGTGAGAGAISAAAEGTPDPLVIEQARRAAALEPGHAQLHFNLGLLLRRARRRSEAIDAFNHALGADPSRVDSCLLLGHELSATGATLSAITLYERWQAANAPNPTVMRALAHLLAREGQAGPAARWAEQAAALDPEPRAWLQLCHSYQQCRRLPEALAAGQRAIQMSGQAWDMYPVPLMVANYLLEDPAPIAALHAEFGAALQLHLQQHLQQHTQALPPRPPHEAAATPTTPARRLRVGYVSADFITHSVAYFIEPLLRHHDRTRFEVWCYHNRGFSDATTQRLQALGHHWVEAEGLSDHALWSRIRNDGIDILVDLAGHTAGGRLRVFGMGAAPLQLSYLGYPTATGVRGMHHRLSDAVIDPGDMPSTGSEAALCLPHSMFCYSPPEAPAIAPEPPSLRGVLTFASFNNLAKLSDHTLALWAQVLQALPQARLLLKAGAAADEGNRRDIEAFMGRHGVAADRLDLRARLGERDEHLALYNEVDVALDTFPFNGATTTCEALWMGVPVVSLRGRTHTSRMGASILTAAGQQQWLAASDAEFVAKAVALAHDEAQRARWRSQARDTLRHSPLLDAPRFAADVEQLLVQAWPSQGSEAAR